MYVYIPKNDLIFYKIDSFQFPKSYYVDNESIVKYRKEGLIGKFPLLICISVYIRTVIKNLRLLSCFIKIGVQFKI